MLKTVSPWKIVLDYYLGNVGGKFILKCQFDTRKLPLFLPVFYRECLDVWSCLAKKDDLTYKTRLFGIIKIYLVKENLYTNPFINAG